MAGGELRVAVGVHDKSSPILTSKHAIDGSHQRSGDLTNVLTSPTSGEAILFEGKKVYISDKGMRLLAEWRQGDRLDEMQIGVYRESFLKNMSDKFWGLAEED